MAARGSTKANEKSRILAQPVYKLTYPGGPQFPYVKEGYDES